MPVAGAFNPYAWTLPCASTIQKLFHVYDQCCTPDTVGFVRLSCIIRRMTSMREERSQGHCFTWVEGCFSWCVLGHCHKSHGVCSSCRNSTCCCHHIKGRHSRLIRGRFYCSNRIDQSKVIHSRCKNIGQECSRLGCSMWSNKWGHRCNQGLIK